MGRYTDVEGLIKEGGRNGRNIPQLINRLEGEPIWKHAFKMSTPTNL